MSATRHPSGGAAAAPLRRTSRPPPGAGSPTG
jgi:hypothetical protein